MMDEEIRQALSEVREMKQMCGNINMKLTNIVTQRGQDWKKKLEAEYQRGLDDAWEAARKVAISPGDGGLSTHDLFEIFGDDSLQYAFKNYSASEAIAKLKDYEEKQKADGEIKAGDVVRWKDKDINDGLALITWIGGKDGKQCNVMCDDGSSGVWNTDEFVKTDRHVDIESILEDMRE